MAPWPVSYGCTMANQSGITAVVPCRHCDAMISVIAEICPHCGVRQLPAVPGQAAAVRSGDISDKKQLPAGLLCLLLGVFGAHKFYVGRTMSGVLMLCTLGGLGLWMLYDLILILTGQFEDDEGRKLADGV